MKHIIIPSFIVILAISLNTFCCYSQNTVFKVDQSYLSKHDVVFKTPAYEGFEGLPVGNGDLGGMIWNAKNGVEIQINKNDLFDKPNEEGEATLRGGVRLSIDLGMPCFEWLYLDDFDGRLSLKNAEVSLSSHTPFMENKIKSWVSVDKNVWFVQVQSNDLKNPNSDRSMIESLFNNCIDASEILKIDTEKRNQWQHIVDYLWPLPKRTVSGEGEVITLAYYKDGSIYPKLDKRNKGIYHFSANTSVVFPSNLIGLDQKGTRIFNAASNVVKNHVPEVNAISPDPIVAARLGLGEVVLERMKNGIRRLQHFPQGLFYNIDHWHNISRYMDAVDNPDITTQRDYIYDQRSKYPLGHPAKPFVQSGLEPLSIYGATVNEMLLQSNEGKIRIFPAIPNGWSTAFKLRARGAFIVASEKKENGIIPSIWVKSLKGNQCKVVNPWNDSKVTIWIANNSKKKIKHKVKNNVIIFNTTSNTSYSIVPKTKEIAKPSIYKGKPNNAPKYFLEAT